MFLTLGNQKIIFFLYRITGIAQSQTDSYGITDDVFLLPFQIAVLFFCINIVNGTLIIVP